MALTETSTMVSEDQNELLTDNSPSKEEKSLEEKIGPKYDTFDGDIDLSAIRKKRFRINGDNNTVLELNTSDMNILKRLEEFYPKLQKLAQEASLKKLSVEEAEDDKTFDKLTKSLVKIDMSMRQMIDEIFDSNVSEVCAPSGSMMDPFNGEFRFEHIIETLANLYESNLSKEFKQMSQRMKKHTAKYTKGK